MTLTLNLSHESSRTHGIPNSHLRRWRNSNARRGLRQLPLRRRKAIITVPAGDTQASLDITITDDAAAESSETITIHWEIDINRQRRSHTQHHKLHRHHHRQRRSETNPVTTLVRNTTETSNSSSNGTHAQSFQTGTNATG